MALERRDLKKEEAIHVPVVLEATTTTLHVLVDSKPDPCVSVHTTLDTHTQTHQVLLPNRLTVIITVRDIL